MTYQLLPPLSQDEYESLKASIAKHGVLTPIEIDENGEILDGHHRIKACTEIGINSWPTVTKTFRSELEKQAYVYMANLARRQLSPEQIKEIRKEQKKLAKALAIEPDIIQEDIAGLLGVKQATISRWLCQDNTSIMQMHNTCIDQRLSIPPSEHPVILERLLDGYTQEQIAANYHVTQQRIAQVAKKERKRRERERHIASLPDPPEWIGEFQIDTVRVADIETLQLPENSVDMVFTDPQYHEEVIHLYGRLAKVAAIALKPGCYCMAYVGKMFLPEIIMAMSEHLEYIWEVAVFHPFSKSKINKHHIFENWRPIVVFKKAGETAKKEWVQDVVRGTRDKGEDEWQQDLEAPMQYIEAYTEPKSIILDPFVGGGTTLEAFVRLGRHYIAFDKKEEAVKKSIERANRVSASLSQS